MLIFFALVVLYDFLLVGLWGPSGPGVVQAPLGPQSPWLIYEHCLRELGMLLLIVMCLLQLQLAAKPV